jgi:hypothetical protein
MNERKERLKQRYRRKVIAFPEEVYIHHADCHFWGRDICTCGLLHDLVILENPEEYFPDFEEHWKRQEGTLILLEWAERNNPLI